MANLEIQFPLEGQIIENFKFSKKVFSDFLFLTVPPKKPIVVLLSLLYSVFTALISCF